MSGTEEELADHAAQTAQEYLTDVNQLFDDTVLAFAEEHGITEEHAETLIADSL